MQPEVCAGSGNLRTPSPPVLGGEGRDEGSNSEKRKSPVFGPLTQPPLSTQRYSSGGMILTKTEVRHQTYLVFLRKEASHGWRTLVPTVPADRPRGQDSPAKPGQDVLRRGHRQGSRLERVARAAHLLG